MTYILAVDPGNTQSAWARIDPIGRRPVDFGKAPNPEVRPLVAEAHTRGWATVIEMVASYGKPVGADVFETCVEIGRFVELAPAARLVYRHEVKLHHCHATAGVTDAVIKQALIDRFASGVRNHGKGTKTQPGWFYGFHKDIWQAYALAIYIADTTWQETAA